jgi:hypothetical protein
MAVQAVSPADWVLVSSAWRNVVDVDVEHAPDRDASGGPSGPDQFGRRGRIVQLRGATASAVSLFLRPGRLADIGSTRSDSMI